MRTQKLTIAFLFVVLTYLSQAAFLPFHKESKTGKKFLDECVQWGIDALAPQSYDHDKGENVVPTYNLTSVVVNYTFEMWQGPPCPVDYNVTASVYCPYVGEKQVLSYNIQPIHH